MYTFLYVHKHLRVCNWDVCVVIGWNPSLKCNEQLIARVLLVRSPGVGITITSQGLIGIMFISLSLTWRCWWFRILNHPYCPPPPNLSSSPSHSILDYCSSWILLYTHPNGSSIPVSFTSKLIMKWILLLKMSITDILRTYRGCFFMGAWEIWDNVCRLWSSR